jgi:hypothetical protein
MEEGLGEGALSGSKEEHSHFVPQMKKTEEWLKNVHDGREQYDAQTFLEYVESFADSIVEHMNHVGTISFSQTADFGNLACG